MGINVELVAKSQDEFFLKKALVRRLQRVSKFLIKIFEEIALCH